MFGLHATSVKAKRLSMSKLLLFSGFLFAISFFCFTSSAETVTDATTLQIKAGHPILFVNDDIITDARGKTSLLNDFSNHIKYCNPILNVANPTTEQIRQAADGLTDGTVHASEGYYVKYIVMGPGVYALLTQDTVGIEYCKQICESILARPVDYASGDGYPTGVVAVLGTLYDWFYDDFSADLRSRIRRRIVDELDYIESTWHYYNNSYFIGGHSHYASIYALVGLLGIRDNVDDDSSEFQDRYFNWLRVIANRWLDGYNPTYEWIAIDGGHHMGFAYGPEYTRILPYLAWEYATNESSWFKDWQDQRTFFYLYNLRNDYDATDRNNGAYDTFPFSGDVFNTAYYTTTTGSEIFMSALDYGNTYAAWIYKSFSSTDYWFRLFYEPTDLDWNSLASSPENLPLSRLFRNTGIVTMRDTWDNDNALMQFKSGSFYSHNHQHMDHNSFTLFYKGPLAIDSGAYSAMGEYNSTHWWNYYIRTIAHNSMLVYNPNECFVNTCNNIISNDGGQKFFGLSGNPGVLYYPTLDQIQDGGCNHLDGIVNYENDLNYTYSAGDATKAYTSKVSGFTRSVVYLRHHSYTHPAAVIYDHVVSSNASYAKTYLLHSINEPAINGKTVTIQNDDGMSTNNKSGLYQETILPSDASLTKVGGRANDEEFLVYDDGCGNPRNYNDEADYNTTNTAWQRAYREAGQWRVEVCPGTSNTTDNFLHVLSVVDEPAAYGKVSAEYVSSANLDGVILVDRDDWERTLVLFQKQTGLLSETIDLTGKNIFNYILLTGVQANTRYAINISGNSLQIATAASGSYRSSSQGTIYCPVDKLSNGLGLLGHWHMNEASWNNTAGEIIDETGNSSGTGKNGATTNDSRFNRGGIFNGTINCYAHLTRNAILNPANAITFSAWVKSNGTTGINSYAGIRNYSYIMRIMNTGSSNIYWGVYLAGPSSWQSISTSPLVAGEWTHLVGTYDSDTGELALYRNGAKVNSRTLTGFEDYHLNQDTGRDLLAGQGVDGIVDEVALWDRALSPSEVALLYRSYTWRTGLLGYWRMNEPSWNNTAGEVIDETGNNNGRASNATTTESICNRCGDFTTYAYANMGNTDLSPTDAITFSAWVNVNSAPAQTALLIGNKGSSFHLSAASTSSAVPSWGIYLADNGGCQEVSGCTALNIGEWTHLTGTYNSNTKMLILYRNGVEVNRKTLNDGLDNYHINQSNYSLLLSQNLDAKLDEVAVWDRALDVNEIYAIYLEGLGGDSMN